MLTLKQLAKELTKKEIHCDKEETEKDNAVIDAINDRGRDLAERKKAVVKWLNSYSVLMGIPAGTRDVIAGEIISFGDERRSTTLGLDRSKIVAEFNQLEMRLEKAASRGVTSLTSKALWSCYPNDVPIFDKNAIVALTVISHLRHLAPSPKQGKYASFVDVWLQVYQEIEPVISGTKLHSESCPCKVRVLDRLLWHVGQCKFYGQA